MAYCSLFHTHCDVTLCFLAWSIGNPHELPGDHACVGVGCRDPYPGIMNENQWG